MRDVRELINPGAAVGVFVYSLGYGIGFFTAQYLLKQKFEKQYAEEISAEAEKMRQFYKVLYKKDVMPEDLLSSATTPVETTDDEEFEDGLNTTVTLEDIEELIEDHEEILEDYQPDKTTEEAVAVVTSVFPEAKIIQARLTEDDVREITKDDVRYLPDDFTNVELTYFREDGVLCHEDGQVIYHPEMVIGLRSFRELDDTPTEQSRIYLLSEQQNKLWLIDLESGAYADTYIQHSARTTSHYKGPKKFRVNDE